MKKIRVALARETALFRYGVIADFVYLPPGAKWALPANQEKGRAGLYHTRLQSNPGCGRDD